MNSKSIGDISEAVITAELVKAGHTVLIPFGDNARYDVAIELNNKLVKIQVKTGRYRNGCVVFSTASSYAHRGGKRRGYVGEIDYFGIYCPELQSFYFVPIDDAPSTEMALRVDGVNKKDAKIKLASTYSPVV